MKNKCVFLDRDGVINEDSPDFVYKPENFHLIDGVKEAIQSIKESGFLVIVITNQSGIARGLYSREDMHACHDLLHQSTDRSIDHIYYAPYHESVSNSLSRKPGSLMFERAIARFEIETGSSWMVGDKARDIIPAKKLGIHTVQVGKLNDGVAEHHADDLFSACNFILEDRWD